MKWFEGSIAEAVAASKSKKAVFVVFIEGKDDTSQEFSRSISSTEVSSRLETEKVVAIKLQSDSENYTFFAQIYQLVPVPSIFFIGESGTPLEIIGSALSPADLASKVDSILLKAYPQANNSANLIQAEQQAHSSSSSNVEDKKTELSSTSEDLTSNNAASSATALTKEESATDIPYEEKVRRAKELIELQKKKKQEEEEQKEREREIERRRTGRDVQKMRQQQQDKELKEAHQERLREKAADAAAREKILKQIAEDKLERKRKYDMHIQEKAAEQKQAQEEAQARAKAAAAATATDMSKARIQFKMPNGNSIKGTFESTSTLGSLRTYVVENAQLPYQQFAMSSFFPRRDFNSNDDNKTLLELDLVPSSVILILPIKSGNPASVIKSTDGAGIFSHFFWTLLAPVVSIYNYVMGYFSGRPRGGNNDNANESTSPGTTLGGNANLAFGRLANIGARRVGGQEATKIRSRGNIHTLRSGDNDNDENNTWNGNSTQQM